MVKVLAQEPRSSTAAPGRARVCVPSKESCLWPLQSGGHRTYVLCLKGFHLPGPLDISLLSHPQEKRIYDLKKKNQELEKFKFVLDYKIKELKKQIEPREKEIKVMKEQIQEVRSQLPLPAPSSPRPPPLLFLAGLRAMKRSSPHNPSLLPRCAQPPLCRGCHRDGPTGCSAVQKQNAVGFLLPQDLRVSAGPTSTSRCTPWALKGKPWLLGVQPPGGDVHSATSLGHQKVQASSSTLFSQTGNVGWGPL